MQLIFAGLAARTKYAPDFRGNKEEKDNHLAQQRKKKPWILRVINDSLNANLLSYSLCLVSASIYDYVCQEA